MLVEGKEKEELEGTERINKKSLYSKLAVKRTFSAFL
jgi:hypothetical protein